MNKKVTRIVSAVMIITMLLSITSVVFGEDKTLKSSAFTPDTTVSTDKLNTPVKTILNIMTYVGIALAVIILMVLAIKYISASPGEKAEIKKSAIPYIVGAILLFGASGIFKIIASFGESVGTKLQ